MGGRSRTTEVPESRLIRDATRGDPDAFNALITPYALAARRVARAVLGDSEDADDVVQDATFSAWQALDRFDVERPFRPWFMRIVTNAALDWHRKQRLRKSEPLAESHPAPNRGPEQHAEAALLRDRLKEGLESLPERQRVAVVLFDAEGYSHAEVAAVLGVPEGTVRSYVFHARRALRSRLGSVMEALR